MGLGLLERYILKKALWSTAIIVLALTGVVWVVRAVQEVNLILNKGQGIFTYLQMTSLGVPTLVGAIVPLALLIGLIRVINSLNEDSELVVMHASGASHFALLRPFFAMCIIASIVVYTLTLWIGPMAMSTLRQFVTAVRADLVSVVVQEGRFLDVGRGLTFHVGERAPGGILKGVFILDGRKDDETFTYLARQGEISKTDEGTYLILSDGQIQRQSADSRNLSVIDFKSYAFNLSSFSGKQKTGYANRREVPTTLLWAPDPEMPLYKKSPGQLQAELHSRLASGFYPIVVGLIILVFMGTPISHRQGHRMAVFGASAAFVGVRGTTMVAEQQLGTVPFMVYPVYLVPIAAIAVCVWLILREKSLLSQKARNLLEKWTHAALARLIDWQKTLAAKTSQSGIFSKRKKPDSTPSHSEAAP